MKVLLSLFILIPGVLGRLNAASETHTVPSDGPEARAAYRRMIRGLFDAGQWELLDRIAGELRISQEKFDEGTWKLSSFYGGLGLSSDSSDEQYTRHFSKLNAWDKVAAESVTPRIARAMLLTNYAWHARGTGFANTVTAEGWKLFGERLAQARQVLEDALSLGQKCPGWHAAMFTIALGQGWSDEEYRKLIAEAIASQPDYYDYYFTIARHYLPRWHGKSGEWERVAKELSQRPELEGHGIYARMAWANKGYHEDIFAESSIEWTLMREGFKEIMARYPKSRWNLINFCWFACVAGDAHTARELFQQIGDNYLADVWDNRKQFKAAQRWAAARENPVTRHREAEITLPAFAGANDAHAISFSPDGKYIAAGYKKGRVVVWDLRLVKPAGAVTLSDHNADAVEWSPDGKLIAVACTNDDKPPGEVFLVPFSPTGFGNAEQVKGLQYGVHTVKFMPSDGKTLFIGGGFSGNEPRLYFGEAHVYDLQKKLLSSLPWGHQWPIDQAAISADGNLIASKGRHSPVAFDIAKNDWPNLPWANFKDRWLFEDQRWSWALAFSPDQTCVAIGTGAPSNQADHAVGHLKIVDCATGEAQPKVQQFDEAGGFRQVAFSRDGALVAAGGHDSTLYVWDAKTGVAVASFFAQPTHGISSIEFSPDGKFLAIAGGKVKLWRLEQITGAQSNSVTQTSTRNGN
jgi:WD40 repeat protein